MYTHIVPTSRNLRQVLFSFGSFGYADVSSPSFMLPGKSGDFGLLPTGRRLKVNRTCPLYRRDLTC